MTRLFLILAAIVLAAQISARADLVKSSILENDIAYLRVGEVGTNLPQEIQSARAALATTNQIAGIVLDLRFADGVDFESAKATANLLAQKKLPLAILVNEETRGEAVALAAILHEAHEGLVFGHATEAIKFTGGPLQPDIAVETTLADEKSFLENPWGTISTNQIHLTTATTNDFLSFPIDHTSEADLVRARIKDGEEDDTIAKPEPQQPFIRDPVLARGLDFIKGEAILRLSHS